MTTGSPAGGVVCPYCKLAVNRVPRLIDQRSSNRELVKRSGTNNRSLSKICAYHTVHIDDQLFEQDPAKLEFCRCNPTERVTARPRRELWRHRFVSCEASLGWIFGVGDRVHIEIHFESAERHKQWIETHEMLLN